MIVHIEIASSSIIVEITPQVIESNHNFTVSVYDTDIEVGTPYLINVTILFNKQFYEITQYHENGELILTAPNVLINKTFIIEAFKDNDNANATIQVIPRKNISNTELVIIPDSYHIEAFELFTILITDKLGNPINNVTVIISTLKNQQIATTDDNGRAMFTAPNRSTITIRAEKKGYDPSIRTLNIAIQEDFYHSLLLYPYTPIIGAIIVLIIVIFYVTIRNRSNEITFSFPKINIRESKITTKKDVKLIDDIQKEKNPSIHNHQWFKSQLKTKQRPYYSHSEQYNSPIKNSNELHYTIDKILADSENKEKTHHMK